MPFSEDEHAKHLEIALQIYQSFSPQLKAIISSPAYKKKRIQPEDHLFFDMHTRSGKKSDPHIVVWFRSKDSRRYIEIAINSENKPSNQKIKKKIKDNRFWDLLQKSSRFELKLFKKNVFINKRGYLYPISSRHYRWLESPVEQIDSNQVHPKNQNNINLWVKRINEFDSDNYKPNNYKNGHPWCDNAIFAFCMVKEYNYYHQKYREYAEDFSELFELYSYLLGK